jgi:hypothetical protein
MCLCLPVQTPGPNTATRLSTGHAALKATTCSRPVRRKTSMSLGTILLIILILLLIGVLPTWPHSRGWGYYPSGGLGLLLLIVLILVLVGRI